MTPERYRQIGELYHAALELDEEKRAAFLERACAHDEGLRREVESLVSSDQQAGNFIATPALAVAAGLFAEDGADALAGRAVSHYKILSLIGSGGMGQVYLAEDTLLGRRVALKFLPEYFTNDKNQVQRFRQEARAASALNHPNILTVYEVGQVDGTEFIATEYVEGETLRARLSRGRFGMREALDVAVQVADALAAAHQAGIVHRDVKPENVMLRGDGYVKVLDFGLAKLTENLSAFRSGGDAITVPDVRTKPGVVMGTPDYMSPEQARGLPVDARADVWSLGVVVYEMLSGQRPFGGSTHSDTIVSILDREPSPLLRSAPGAPAELNRIVTKALMKNVDERYQSIKDMAIDLRRLRRRQEVEAEIGLSTPLEANGYGSGSTGEKAIVSSAREHFATRTGKGSDTAPTSSLEFAVTEIRRHKAGVALAAVLFISVLVGGGYALSRLLSRNRTEPARPSFQAMKIARLTSEGSVREAAISSDGRYVAYVLRDAGRETLKLHQVATSSDLPIVAAAEAVCIGLTFSPDGDYIYYVSIKEPGASLAIIESMITGTLYRVPVLGGASQKLIDGVDSPVTFSPDGKRLAFVRYDEECESAIMVANADGSGTHRLTPRGSIGPYWGRGRFGGGPAWSPDGKVIACVTGRFDKQQVMAVSAADGSQKLIGSQIWRGIGRLSWLPDGSGLVMTGVEQGFFSQLVRLSYPRGEVSKITNDLNIYTGASLDANAASLVTVQTEPRTQHLWVMAAAGKVSDAKKIASMTGTGEGSWAPDGRIVYVGMANDRWNLWIANHDGNEQKQLTTFTNQVTVRPNVCPNGRYIVFVSDRAGPRNIWRVDIDGSNPVRLTSGSIDTWPTCSPDGRWVIYTSPTEGRPTLWKVPIDGGDRVSLGINTFSFTAPSVSPDGNLIAYADRDVAGGSHVKIVVIPFDGGGPVKTFDLPPTASLDVPVHWTSDGRALTYVDSRDGTPNVWSQPLEGGTPKRLTEFTSDQIYTFDWSHDGKQLALWRGSPTRNVVLISDFR